jgi:DNA primase
MSQDTQRIKERVGIADVISSYVKLEKAGKNFKARCPFHHEKTPSFFVSPERDSYYCFGCGAHGDIFSFVEQFEGLDFPGALKVLAERAGITLTQASPEDKEKYTRLFSLLEAATLFYEKQLVQHTEAKKYLIDRGIQEKTVHTFRLGFVEGPETGGWRALHDHLIAMKFTVQEIERAGLIKKSSEPGKESSLYDVFRSRIMFPLFDTSGRVIAFSGRHFGREGTEAPKYLNSPETVLFKKGAVLYGLDRAKLSIRKYDFSILVEGQFDLISAHQAGFTNTVAVSGTALTVDHIDRLNRLSKNIVIALDSDAAGVASTLKSARVALEAGMDVKVAVFPEGKDPADVIKENVDIWKTAIRSATHVIEFLLKRLASVYGQDARAFKKHVRNEVVPFLSLLGDKIDRKHFVGLIAEKIGVDEQVIEEEAATVAFSDSRYDAPLVAGSKEEITDRKSRLIRQIVAYITSRNDSEDAIASREKVVAILGYNPFSDATASERDVFALEEAIGEFGEPMIHINEMLFSLHEEVLKEQYADARAQLMAAEQIHDEKKVTESLMQCQKISRELSTLRTQRS